MSESGDLGEPGHRPRCPVAGRARSPWSGPQSSDLEAGSFWPCKGAATAEPSIPSTRTATPFWTWRAIRMCPRFPIPSIAHTWPPLRTRSQESSKSSARLTFGLRWFTPPASPRRAEAGENLQRDLTERAVRRGLALCGPNSFGFINTLDAIAPFGGVERTDRPGPIGIVSQSAGFLDAIRSSGSEVRGRHDDQLRRRSGAVRPATTCSTCSRMIVSLASGSLSKV